MSTVIRQVDLFTVTYPVQGRFRFFESPSGQSFGRATVVVKITADNGEVGWGQCVPSHRWSYETLESVESTLRIYLAPLLIGRDPFEMDQIHELMNQTIAPSFSTGQPICKAGVDLALFDLIGKLQGQSAAQRWGRTYVGATSLSWTLNPRTLNEAENEIQAAHGRGYRHFNIKVAPNLQFDRELCRLARRLAPDAIIWADANGGYHPEDAHSAATVLADLGFVAFEQPTAPNRLSALSSLRRQGAIPIVLDEPIVSLVELREFHQAGLLDGAAIKVARCGGLTEARRQVEYLLDNELLFLGSGLTDPDVSLAASLCLFDAYKIPFPAALNGPQFLCDFLHGGAESLLHTPLETKNGAVKTPQGPGLGVSVDEKKLFDLCSSFSSIEK